MREERHRELEDRMEEHEAQKFEEEMKCLKTLPIGIHSNRQHKIFGVMTGIGRRDYQIL